MLRVNSDVKYGHWVTVMHQCSFIGCNKHTALVGLVDRFILRLYGNSILSAQFAVNLKLL